MAEIPPTRPSLLVRVRDVSDAAAWAEFVELYGPLVYTFARRRGLQDADAADLTQTVFGELARDQVRHYDAARGLFRRARGRRSFAWARAIRRLRRRLDRRKAVPRRRRRT